METLIIERLNGVRQDINEIRGARLLEVIDNGPQPETQYEQMEGLDGSVENGTTFRPRTITVRFWFKGIDILDYTLAQREIWKFLFSYEPYYIAWTRLPGLRYLVQCTPFTDTRLNPMTGTYEVDFVAFTGFAESVGRTDIHPINMDSEIWQMVGQGLILDEDLIYSHSQSTFKIYNAGDITINPRSHYHTLQITIKGVGRPTLKNLDTGDVFTYNKNLKSSDTLILDGVYPLLNGVHCGRDTNHGLITLKSGWNQIQLSGIANPQTIFGFRFLYK